MEVVTGTPAPHCAAMIQLCSRLWQELEHVARRPDLDGTASPAAALAIEIVRLELVLLDDACVARWRTLLPEESRLGLRALVADLLAILAAPPGLSGLQAVLEAQNRLFDTVRRLFSLHSGRLAVEAFAHSERRLQPAHRLAEEFVHG